MEFVQGGSIMAAGTVINIECKTTIWLKIFILALKYYPHHYAILWLSKKPIFTLEAKCGKKYNKKTSYTISDFYKTSDISKYCITK